MSKKIFFLLLIAVTLVLVIFVLRFLSPEDAWLCSGGQWVKHGNPSASIPTSACPGATVDYGAGSEPNIDSIQETVVGDWVAYQNQELNFQFSYPKEFGDFNLQILSTQLRGNFFSQEAGFSVGGITKDFSSPRSGFYMDFSGWKKEGKNYFWGFVGDDYKSIVPKEIINDNVILVDCMSFEDRCHQTGPSISVSQGHVAGLVNLEDDIYPGLIFYTSEENENLLKQILNTFRFLDQDTVGGSVGLANPASVNCVDNSGTLKIETLPNGGQYGVCYFEENHQCEEWSLMRGDCPVGGRKVTGYITEAGRYCAITGGEYMVTVAGDQETEKGNCQLPSGEICEAEEYYLGACPFYD
jgi:putative hemolysin